jgi:hypothetical protein
MKLRNILNLIQGTHCLGEDGLRDYHAAKEVRDAARCKFIVTRFARISEALRPYNVMVSRTDNRVRIFKPTTQEEMYL